jgi:hypothetical protein
VKNPVSVLRERIPTRRRDQIEKAVKVTAGTAAALWVVLQLRRELYGPGGTKLSRYDRAVDKIWPRS